MLPYTHVHEYVIDNFHEHVICTFKLHVHVHVRVQNVWLHCCLGYSA